MVWIRCLKISTLLIQFRFSQQMNTGGNCYIIVSVFYNKRSWHTFINRFVVPFIKENQECWPNLSFLMHLGSNYGEHIKLTFRVDQTCMIDFDKLMRTSIIAFIENNPSDDKKMIYPLGNYFANYPNNSLWYNPSIDDLTIVQAEISKAMLGAFGSDDEIDDENLVTFLVYMQLVVIRTYYPDLSIVRQIIPQLKDVASEVIGSTYSPGSNDLSGTARDNELILADIIRFVWEAFPYNELIWLKDWSLMCKNLIHNEAYFNLQFIQWSRLICQHIDDLNTNQLEVSLNLIIKGLEFICEG